MAGSRSLAESAVPRSCGVGEPCALTARRLCLIWRGDWGAHSKPVTIGWLDMQKLSSEDSRLIALAEDAAEQLLDARSDENPSVYEPTDLPAAQAAVRRLAQRFEGVPGAIADALDAARNSGDLLSSDHLQGIAEIIQNADDVDATQVRLRLGPSDLWVEHDGSPVRLRDVLGLAIPWLSTKGNRADTNGRFGIGLMTLRSLSDTLEVHCHPYHVRLEDATLSSVDPPELPIGFHGLGWTTLRVPLDRREVSQDELQEWLSRWDDAALLFLRSITKVALLASDGATIHELAISRHDAGKLRPGGCRSGTTVLRQCVEAADGRSWVVYSNEAPTTPGMSRTRKATDDTTPVAIALPQYLVVGGQIHAGLPVARTRLNLFVNAQFDPLTSRQGFSNNPWNQSLVPLVAELWSQAALDLFSRDPKAAWQAVPVPDDTGEPDEPSFIGWLENAVIASARERVAAQLTFPVPEHGELGLSRLAVEAEPLEHILTVTETAWLAGLPAALPFEVRDQDAIWREVLDDWRSAGANIREPVGVERALDLLEGETRSPLSTIELAAAGLDAGLDHLLSDLPCIIANDGRRVVPPRRDDPETLATSATSLAEQLGVVTLLHSAYLGDGVAARIVLRWLRESGALLEDLDDRLVVRRLSAAGKAGRQLEKPLTDEQVLALRAAFERMELAELQELAPNIGNAVSLQAFEYQTRGRNKTQKAAVARPVDAYLPRTVDRETDSFAVAADRSPGISWLSDHYAGILRSSSGRAGIGAQRFLRLLGAETTPRLRLHPESDRYYSGDPRPGLSRSIAGGPSDRGQALVAIGADYTLNDRGCPALAAVILDISRVRRGKGKRRRRASAVLASLARSWDRSMGEFTDVDAVYAHRGWQPRGRVPAYWLWAAQEVAWLDDESGTPRRPSELRIRTPGTEAIYGKRSPDYLHPELSQSNWRTVLASLGVSGDPSRSELVNRLKELRASSVCEDGITDEELRKETAVVYKALAHSLSTGNVSSGNSRTDLSQDRLRREFQRGPGLVFSTWGWLPPLSVLSGPPIFGEYMAFAPAIAETERLWEALRLRQPSLEDCLAVIRAIARTRRPLDSGDEAVMLETLRALASHCEGNITTQVRDKLRALPLWTSQGWMRKRPVYATDDPVLAASLKDRLPLWEPGGELQQFRQMLGLLRVEEVGAGAEVIEPELAIEDDDLSDLFRLALQQLQDDLSRNDPELAKTARMSWDLLGRFSVHVHPTLSLVVTTGGKGAEVQYECEVAAKVDQDRGVLFVGDRTEMSRVDSGGRAVAALFDGDTRRVAQAWRAACDQAESGRLVRAAIELAEQRKQRQQERTEQEIRERTMALGRETAARHYNNVTSRGRNGTTPSPSVDDASREGDANAASRRVLVDPDSLTLVSRQGKLEEKGPAPGRKTAGNAVPAAPRPGVGGPTSRSSITLYTPLDRETVGLELLRMVLGSDHDEIEDLRAQRGVGADAIDELQRFYELKVHAGGEPDQVTLTNAEVKRALTTKDFFLVVVSSVEGVDANPKVRIIVDPLRHLQPAESGAITLTGIRGATSRTYDFTQIDVSTPEGALADPG